MSNGVYGTIRPSNIDVTKDVEIFYSYRPTRGSEDASFSDNTFKSLNANCLVPAQVDDTASTKILGLYNLALPVNYFNKKGIYTIYIRPKEIILEIKDVSTLADYTDIKGIVINKSDITTEDDMDLTGYRVEYFEDDNRKDLVRLITSCNYCSPVITTTDGKARYKLSDSSSSLLFCTLTPSTANSFKPNAAPYIGVSGGKIAIINTKFNPIMMEIEMVEHDADTLSYALEGDQIRDRDNSILTTFNDNHEPYSQQDFYTLKDSLGNPQYDVKRKKDTLTSIDYDDIIGGTE